MSHVGSELLTPLRYFSYTLLSRECVQNSDQANEMNAQNVFSSLFNIFGNLTPALEIFIWHVHERELKNHFCIFDSNRGFIKATHKMEYGWLVRAEFGCRS